jgi:hypothetical protein
MTGAIAGDDSCDVGPAMLFTWDLRSWCEQCRIADFRRKEGSSTFMFQYYHAYNNTSHIHVRTQLSMSCLL